MNGLTRRNVTSRKPKILLLDAYSTRTLACVRSFGRRGLPFAVGGHTRWDISLHSRYSRERFVYASPYVSIERFVDDVNTNCERFGADLVLPTSEAAILACDVARDRLRADLLGPSRREIELLLNKRSTLELAGSLGVRTPTTRPLDASSLSSVSDLQVRLPAVLKPSTSAWIDGDRIVQAGSTVYAYTADDLARKTGKMLARAREVLLQEFVDGYGIAISGVFANGEPTALFAHRRIRESNPLGGPSAVAVSISPTDALRDSALRLMRETRYTGPAMVEYRLGWETGTPYLMEVNARFWGSVPLSMAAGADLPYAFWCVATGADRTDGGYREGVVGRNLFGDTKHLVTVLRGRPAGWPGRFPRRSRAVGDYLSLFFSRTNGLLYARDDPGPAFARVGQELFAR